MTSTSEYLEVQNVPHAGVGLFAKRDIDPSTLLAGVDPITVKALSEARLKDTCYHCQEIAGDDHSISHTKPQSLKLCTGCRTVRYCSVPCQKSSWSTVHQQECKIFRSLAPRVLPNNVRAIMHLLLLREADKLRPGEWDYVLSLNDHLKEIREAGGQSWENIVLSARAATVYLGTKVDEMVVMRLFGILMTNSFTMVTPTYDPLGVALCPFAARMNHSCEYNATVRFREGRWIDIVPLRTIEEGEEITISYIDELMPVKERREELRERYFFMCNCARCAREESIPNSKPLSRIENEVYHQAVDLLGVSEPDIEKLTSALRILHQYGFAPTTYPLPSLRQMLITTYLSLGRYNHAFIHALLQCLTLDPTLYPVAHHPLRLVHAWLCVKITDYLLSMDTAHSADDLSLAKFGINLDFLRHTIMLSLHRAVHVSPEGEFSRMVDGSHEEEKVVWIARYGQNFANAEAAGMAYRGRYTGEGVLKAKWTEVRKAIEAVLEEERRS